MRKPFAAAAGQIEFGHACIPLFKGFLCGKIWKNFRKGSL
jgi:hypothetical protein